MRDNMENIEKNDTKAARVSDIPRVVNEKHAKELTKDSLKGYNSSEEQPQEQFSLNDDRRVKVLSPGAMVAKRFFRNRLAVTGLGILIFMFIFSFIGGMVSPYAEDEVFYRVDYQKKEYAAVIQNEELRFASAETDIKFDGIVQAQTMLAIQKKNEEFSYKDVNYTVLEEGTDFYTVHSGGKLIGIGFKDIINSTTEGEKIPFDLQYNALKAYANKEAAFSVGGASYELDADGIVTKDGAEVAYISRYIVQAVMGDVFLTREFKNVVTEAIEEGKDTFVYTGTDGVEYEYPISYDASKKAWSILQEKETRIFDTYSYPSKEHWLGTDKNGMDMLTRIMYGGRVSLVIGFIVVVIQTLLGVVLGGVAGYFGGWVDNLIMRLVDIFYCIPNMPIIIIVGAAMDGMRVDPTVRMFLLMLLLGFLGWASIARLVRGQILSLREQEFMTATEATGIRTRNRIFKHLIPNVIPQLIVNCTMALGSTIITESTLSFLGLGVKFPFASWGNIINDVNDTYVLTTYWFIWIPAGICLLLTVLAFNILGDGLRDAFDPKMKR